MRDTLIWYVTTAQQLVADDARIRYCSLHEEGGYPRTGSAAETGSFGNVLNVPLASGGGWPEYEVSGWEVKA